MQGKWYHLSEHQYHFTGLAVQLAPEYSYTKEKLANGFKEQFKHLGDKPAHYWQGLAEYTALRIREFGTLTGYKNAGVKYYKLLVIMDDNTSDI